MATPATQNQIPDNSILDANNKQIYLGNQFVYAIGSVEILSTSEIPFLLVSNASTNKQALFSRLRKILTLTASQSAILRFYSSPTVTGIGTPVVPINLRPASSTISVAAVSTSPTISANGTLVDVISSPALVSGQSDLMSVLDPGQSMLVTIQTSSATTFVSSELSWYEL